MAETCNQCGQTLPSKEQLEDHNRQMHASGSTPSGTTATKPNDKGGMSSEKR